LVRAGRLELPPLSRPGPKPGASASSATLARAIFARYDPLSFGNGRRSPKLQIVPLGRRRALLAIAALVTSVTVPAVRPAAAAPALSVATGLATAYAQDAPDPH